MMKKINKALILSLVILSVISCDRDSWFDIDEPEVSLIYPLNESRGVESKTVIYVEFSEKMDKPKTESAFSIESESGTPEGYFRWEGNRLYFELIEELKNGDMYTIRIDKSAEDSNGNNIKEEKESRFYVGDDFEKPEVVSFSISRIDQNGTESTIRLTDGMTGVAWNDSIIIEFSEPVSRSSCENGFSISPDVIGTKELIENDTKLKFTPYSGFENRTTYTISLTDDITDTVGNKLLEEKKLSFLVGSDLISPTLDDPDEDSVGIFAVFNDINSKLEFNNLNESIVEKNSEIKIVFSEAMKREETMDAISVTPSVDYYIDWSADNKTAILKLYENSIYELNTIYAITVSDTATDTWNNNLDREYSTAFKINGPDSKSIFVEDVVQMKCDASGPDEDETPWSLGNTYDSIFLSPAPLASYNPTETTQTEVYVIRIYFNNDNNTLDTRGIDLISAYNSISFEFDSYTGSDPGHTSLHPVIWKISNPTLHPNAVDIYIYNLEPENYYKLKIDGEMDGLLDKSSNGSDGNYMSEDYVNYYRT